MEGASSIPLCLLDLVGRRGKLRFLSLPGYEVGKKTGEVMGQNFSCRRVSFKTAVVCCSLVWCPAQNISPIKMRRRCVTDRALQLWTLKIRIGGDEKQQCGCKMQMSSKEDSLINSTHLANFIPRTRHVTSLIMSSRALWCTAVS